MKANWLLLLLVFFVILSSCDNDEPDGEDNQQFISGTFDGQAYYFGNKVKGIYYSDALRTEIVFTLNNPVKYDEIKITFLNTDLKDPEKIEIPYEFTFPLNPLIDPIAGIELMNSIDSSKYTLIAGYNPDSKIKINSLWFKELSGTFSGRLYSHINLNFDPPDTNNIDSIIVMDGSFNIYLDDQ